MSLFVCEKCKNIENTATSSYWWSDKKLCRFCEKGKKGKTENGKFNEEWEYLESTNFVGRKGVSYN